MPTQPGAWDPVVREEEWERLVEFGNTPRRGVYGPPVKGTVIYRGTSRTAIREGDGSVWYVGLMGGIHEAGGRVAGRFIPHHE